MSGFTNGDLDGNTHAGLHDLIVIKYNSSGVKQWTKLLGTYSDDNGYGITSDSSGSVNVTGWTNDNLGGIPSAGNYDLFVVKYNSSGVRQWIRKLETSGSEYGQSITSDSSGSVYVTGWTNDDLDGNTRYGSSDLFVVKYNSDGVKQWTQQLGTSFDDRGHDITSDSSGNVYVTGYTKGNLDGNTNAGGYDLIVVKYDTNGNKQ